MAASNSMNEVEAGTEVVSLVTFLLKSKKTVLFFEWPSIKDKKYNLGHSSGFLSRSAPLHTAFKRL